MPIKDEVIKRFKAQRRQKKGTARPIKKGTYTVITEHNFNGDWDRFFGL